VTDEQNEEVVNEPTPEAASDAQAEASTSEETPDAAPTAEAEDTTPTAEAKDTTETSNEAVAESGEAAPVAEEAPAVEETPAAPVAAEAGAGEPVAVDPTSIVEGDVEYIEEDAEPRVKPAIPGADLTPDIVSDGSEYLDAEARAAAEAEAEEAAARAAEEGDGEVSAQPIAEVAINLAAGARYTATGKRKSGVARVILKPGTGTYTINGKTLEEYFPRDTLQRIIRQPLEAVGYEARMDVVARMHGGGVSAQAGALRHGISRALLEADPNLRGELKRRGFLTRDPRVKERKKAGLKKARKRPQFSKR
jgi:small subunit ribosomal protein S9